MVSRLMSCHASSRRFQSSPLTPQSTMAGTLISFQSFSRTLAPFNADLQLRPNATDPYSKGVNTQSEPVGQHFAMLDLGVSFSLIIRQHQIAILGSQLL